MTESQQNTQFLDATLHKTENQNKPILNAESLAFTVIQKIDLDDIKNVSSEEKVLYIEALDTIQKIENLCTTYSQLPFTFQNYQSFETYIWSFLNKLNECTAQANDLKVVEKLKQSFRSKIHKFLTQSLISSRALTKPFGYPGDYTMMQYLYDNQPISPTHIGKYFDQFFLNDPLARAVVNRVTTMSQKLSEFIQESPNESLNILNIASGPGFDLIKIASTRHDKQVTVHCFDQEPESLAYVKAQVAAVNINTTFKFYKADIRTFFKEWNQGLKFDYIYNIGLADYLTDRILQKLMQESINNLFPGGKLVIAHKDYTLFPSYHPAWLYDWNFIERSFEDNLSFIKENLEAYSDINYFYESSQRVIYFNEFTK